MEQQEMQRQNEAQRILFEQQRAAKLKKDAEEQANQDQLKLQQMAAYTIGNRKQLEIENMILQEQEAKRLEQEKARLENERAKIQDRLDRDMSRLNEDEIMATTEAASNEQDLVNLKNWFKAELLSL